MKKIKILSPVSIDGFSSRINGDMDWATSRENVNLFEKYDFTFFFEGIDCIVMNRTQYLLLQMQEYGLWPLRNKPYYVLSHKGYPVTYNYSAHSEMLFTDERRRGGMSEVDHIRQLQAYSGEGDIWVMGDHRLTAILLQHDMIDEIHVLHLPVTLGSGLPFLGGFGSGHHWSLSTTVRNYPDGIFLACYSRTENALYKEEEENL